MFAVWPQTPCHNELTRALVSTYIDIENDVLAGVMNAYITLPLHSSLFIPAINPSKPEIIPWKLGPLTSYTGPAECMWTARDSTALVRRSARLHIGDVTVYVTWHVLWCTQWTLTTGMVVVTIGVEPAHLQLSDSTMGPALWGFHHILIIFRQRPKN